MGLERIAGYVVPRMMISGSRGLPCCVVSAPKPDAIDDARTSLLRHAKDPRAQIFGLSTDLRAIAEALAEINRRQRDTAIALAALDTVLRMSAQTASVIPTPVRARIEVLINGC